jgi:hypothetical protein
LSEDFLGVLSSNILSRWPNQLTLAPLSILLYFLLCSSLLPLYITLYTRGVQ